MNTYRIEKHSVSQDGVGRIQQLEPFTGTRREARAHVRNVQKGFMTKHGNRTATIVERFGPAPKVIHLHQQKPKLNYYALACRALGELLRKRRRRSELARVARRNNR